MRILSIDVDFSDFEDGFPLSEKEKEKEREKEKESSLEKSVSESTLSAKQTLDTSKDDIGTSIALLLRFE